jgi:hypothetical protein
VWAGRLNFQAGGHLVAVEYDGDETAAALRQRCARWATSDTIDVPAVFGVRVAKVGFRRRRVGVVHHGAPVRYRLDGLTAAVDAIATFLADLDREVPDGAVAVAARAFARGERVALLDMPLSIDLDERPLDSLGIEEIPTWRPVIELARGRVTAGDRSGQLAGFVVAQPMVADLDSARRHVWSLGSGPRLPWAEFVDGLGDRIVYDVTDLVDALDRALR